MPVLVVKTQPLIVLDVLVDLELEHDPVEGDFGNALDEVGLQLARIEVLAGHDADPGELGELRRVRGGRRIVLHQLAEQREIGDRIHPVDLLAHGRLHVDRRIDLAGGGV